jgi:protein SCO1/2
MSTRRAAWIASLLSAILPFVAVPPAAGQIPVFDRVRVLAAPRTITAVELTDHEGRPFDLGGLRGKVAFVLFGFTNCPDVCPLSLERLRELHDGGTLEGKAVAYVLISVDGERDTPAAMKAFLAKYSADFIGLTTDPARVKPIAAEFAAAFYKGAHTGHDGGYDVAHSPQIFVVDPHGQLRAELYGASIDAMTGVANALLDEVR